MEESGASLANARCQPPLEAGAEQTLAAVACPPPLSQSLSYPGHWFLLFALCAQRASLGIMLSRDTAGRGTPDATSNLFVHMRSKM